MHHFSKLEIAQAKHELDAMIKNYIGDLWQLKSDSVCVGKSWECRSMIALDAGLWRLCQAAVHAGAKRALGVVEEKDSGHMLLIKVFYEPVEMQ